MLKIKIFIAAISILAIVAGFAIPVGAAGLVNINIATQEELMQLEGVGSAYAQKIIEYREANGPFENPEDIMNVKGIGEATFEKNKDRITVALGEKDTSGSD
jgi:competence protein ComEA